MHHRRVLPALLTVVLALGTLVALQAPASAATARSLSAVATPTGAVAGSSVAISGTLSKSPKGSAVTIQRKVGTKWVTARSVKTTTAAGKYSGRVTLPTKVGTYSFRAVAAAKGNLKAATSKTLKVGSLTRVAATIKASPTTVTAGASSTLSGTVKPFSTGTTVTFQKFVGNKWLSTGVTTKVVGGGKFSKAVVVKDSTVFRASVARSGMKAPAVSIGTGVVANPKISTTSLPTGTQGTPYVAQLTQVGTTAGTWSVTPALPTGLTLNASTGRITGTPTTTTSAPYTFKLAQPAVVTASKALTLTITAPVPPTIATTSLAEGTVDEAYSQTLTAAGNPAGTWTATPLPAGLALNATTGVISGTPTTAGTTSVAVGFTQTSTSLAATPKNLSLKINPPPPPPGPVISTVSLPDANGALLATYSAQLTAVGNPAGTWSVTGLPSGITANASGALSKNPLAVVANGTYVVTVNFTATGNPTPATPVNLTLTVGTRQTLVAAGGRSACRVDEDQVLSCWGNQDAGQLGLGGNPGNQTPVIKPTAVTGTGWTDLTQSGSELPAHAHGCGIREAVASCWGDDSSGQLGDGANGTNRTVPGPVNGGAIWSTIDAGHETTCGITLTGALWCWGDNAFYQLGLGLAEAGNDKTVPTRVGTDNDWKQVTLGYNGACATKTTGTLWCWGQNYRGQLGTGDKSERMVPTQVGTDSNWSGVSNGAGFTCATRTTGTLWCWGFAGDGALGNGVTLNDSSTDQTTPLQVGTATSWASVSSDKNHSCATTTTGQVWCWGANASGQIGDNTEATKAVPTRVGTASDWSAVAAGGSHTCAAKSTGAVWCWGSNANGQLGINSFPGTTPNSKVPVAVNG